MAGARVGATSLRPLRGDDEAFLIQVLAASRAEELALLPWDAEQKHAFVCSQHRAQRAHFERGWPDASYEVVLLDGEPAGRLYVHRGQEAIHVLEIALLAEHRGKGIGTGLLVALQDEAAGRGVGLTVQVERRARALRLYERLGFRPVADRELHLLMEWRPARVTGRPAT